MDFSQVKAIEIPNGTVKKITVNDVIVWQSARLPGAYLECEWIASDGNQYIQTNYTYNATTHDIITFDFMPLQTNTDTCFFGIYQTGHFMQLGQYQGYYRGNTAIDNRVSVAVNTRTVAIMGTDGKWSINNVTFGQVAQGNGTIAVPLFGQKYISSIMKREKCRLYHFNVKRNNVDIADYVPCYRKSDNVIGIYDLVTKTFFTNAGTGTFTKGPDV